MTPKFIDLMQSRIAQASIGPSSLRNQGKSQVIKICRDFCSESMNLSKYTLKTFKTQLDKDTRRLLKKLGMKETQWGTARKALNLFLRDVFYNKYLSPAYKMEMLEPLLEIPLDNQIAEKIQEYPQGKDLPWNRIKHTTEDENKAFQDAALLITKENKLIKHRVHLDLIFWRSVE
jgi:hypothetical protein